MRAYFFGNMYLSSIQQGIQAAHCISDMFIKYSPSENDMLTDWGKNHKTMILLNGGYSSNLSRLYTLLNDPRQQFPIGKFYEGSDELNGALTCVGIILPEYMYNHMSDMRMGISDNQQTPHLTEYELIMCEELARYGLAS